MVRMGCFSRKWEQKIARWTRVMRAWLRPIGAAVALILVLFAFVATSMTGR